MVLGVLTVGNGRFTWITGPLPRVTVPREPKLGRTLGNCPGAFLPRAHPPDLIPCSTYRGSSSSGIELFCTNPVARDYEGTPFPIQYAPYSTTSFLSSSRRLDRYGFIGLGQMGYQMAKNLQSKLSPSDSVRLFDINKDAMHRLAEDMRTSQAGGAVVELADSVAEAAKEADTVVTVLPEPSHVKGVYSEILQSDLSPKSRIFIDSSTIDPSSSREVAKWVADAKQGQFVDAPMSGGVVGATAGALTFMLGSPNELVSKIEPILLRMGKRVLHCGVQGTGLSAKLANNYLLAINNIATAEAMNLGIRWGLEPKTLANIINVSTGRCWPSEVNNPVKGVVETAPAGRDYAGGFGISLMKKDLKLAIMAAEEASAKLELGARAREVYEEAEKVDSCKGRDFSVIYRFLGGKE